MAITTPSPETLMPPSGGTGDNPYDLPMEAVQPVLEGIVRNRKPYIDGATNPDIGNFAIYIIDGNDPDAVVARALEGRIHKADWGEPAEVTLEDAEPYEKNSEFFVLVDKTNPDNPKAAGALRIADALRGPTETVTYFHDYFGEDKEVPEGLMPDGPGQDMWDIVGVVVDNEYRDGEKSSWLYHALYRNSLERGVNKWVSNINPKEIRNLRKFIGIPFKEVPEVGPAPFVSPLDGKTTEFRFYNIDVSTIIGEVSWAITEREGKGDERSLFLARLSRIALLGATSSKEIKQAS